MAPTPNRRVVFNKVPKEFPVAGETMRLEDHETIDLESAPLGGGALIKSLDFSIDPYMRGRLRDPSVKSYAPAQELGKPMVGNAVSIVLRSEASKFKVGDLVVGFTPWQEYNVIPADSQHQDIPKTVDIPPEAYLGVCGGPGRTAFYSLRKFAKMKKGETILVSTAAGAVGSVVCQLAKLNGLKVVGATGDDEKVKWLKEEAGVDHAFNYKKVDLWKEIKEHGPYDIYYDNVGGEFLDAAIANLNQYGRVLNCGYASEYNRGSNEAYGVKSLGRIVPMSLSLNGFIQFDLIKEAGLDVFQEEYMPIVKEGKIKFQTHKYYGIENLENALVGIFKGENKGKAVVEVAKA